MPRLTKEEWQIVRRALEDLSADPPGTWQDDPEVEAFLATIRKVLEKIE